MNSVDHTRGKKTKAQKKKDTAKFMDKLRNTPEEKLSPMAKYWLKHEHDEPISLNMRYVLKGIMTND